MSPSQMQQQLMQVKTKNQNQIKKNNNLLKMNSNLMRQNELYQNHFSTLKMWSNNYFQLKYGQENEQSQDIEDTCIDIEEEGEQFIRSLMQKIERKINTLEQHLNERQNSQTQIINQQSTILPEQCQNCLRWKQLYIKQNKQTSRLQRTLDQSSLFSTQKQINIVKLKNDISNLLQDYLNLYRKQFRIGENQSKILEESSKLQTRQTVRMKEKSKEKGSDSGGRRKKALGNSRSSKEKAATKQPSAFSKQKTLRATKYAINLQNQAQPGNSTQVPCIPQPPEISLSLNQILNSYSQLSKSLESQNYFMKEQLKQFNEILMIYRQKQRNRILYK